MYITEIGKVAKIPDEYTIVVTALPDARVDPGETVMIFEEVSNVTDPESGEKIDSYRILKSKLQVVDVFQKYFTCSKIEEKTIEPFELPALQVKKIKEKIKLDVNNGENENIKLRNKGIAVGDIVMMYQ